MDQKEIIKMLDFNLQEYSERSALVQYMSEAGALANATPATLDKVANYLLYAKIATTAVCEAPELKNSASHRCVSYEELCETSPDSVASAGASAARSSATTKYRYPKPTISHDPNGRDYAIPGMRDLWDSIAFIKEKYDYCRNVLNGSIPLDLERPLIPTYQTKYFLHEWMVDLCREQFLLRDFYYPVVCSLPVFAQYAPLRCTDAILIGDHFLCPGETEYAIDFGNWKHVYELLKNYSSMRGAMLDLGVQHPWWPVYDFLDQLLDRIPWTPEYYHILVRKIDHAPNEVIAKELEDMFGKSYSVNYISTIFKQNISKLIVRYAYLWWEEYKHPLYGVDGIKLSNAVHWKICPICGETKYAHELNFNQFADGTWRDECRQCRSGGLKNDKCNKA